MIYGDPRITNKDGGRGGIDQTVPQDVQATLLHEVTNKYVHAWCTHVKSRF